MSGDDPFERLSANLNKPVEKAAGPLTPKDLYDKATVDLPMFFEAINKFDDIVMPHGGRVRFTFDRAEVLDHLAFGRLNITANSRVLATLPIMFQSKALWITDDAFVKFAGREAEKGNWAAHEMGDLIGHLSDFIASKLPRASS